jgi:hypothetical protein
MNDQEFKKPSAYKNVTAMEARPILKPSAYKNVTAMEARPILKPILLQHEIKEVNILTRMLSKLKFW